MEIKNLKFINKGSLVASFDLYITKYKVTFRDCVYMKSEKAEWINYPSREYLDNENKKKYFRYIMWDKEIESIIAEKVLALVKAQVPTVQDYKPIETFVEDELPF